MYAVINIEVEIAREKPLTLKDIFLEYDIRNKPTQTIDIPIKPGILISEFKNKILIIAINKQELPLEIG